MTFEDSETKTEEEEADEAAADQLQQLVHTFCQGAMVERSADAADDDLYMSYANIMARQAERDSVENWNCSSRNHWINRMEEKSIDEMF